MCVFRGSDGAVPGQPVLDEAAADELDFAAPDPFDDDDVEADDEDESDDLGALVPDEPESDDPEGFASDEELDDESFWVGGIVEVAPPDLSARESVR